MTTNPEEILNKILVAEHAQKSELNAAHQANDNAILEMRANYSNKFDEIQEEIKPEKSKILDEAKKHIDTVKINYQKELADKKANISNISDIDLDDLAKEITVDLVKST